MIDRIKNGVKNLSAFSLGMFVGVIYGSVVGTLVTASMVGLP